MSSSTVFALHGFLGRPSDWDPVLPQSEKIDYLQTPELQPHQSLESWGKSFNQWVLNKKISGKKILCGYSLGGRLALHALKDNQNLWDAAILISANPVVPESEKLNRKKNDEQWAQRFLKEDFKNVVKDWNEQEVFLGSVVEPQRDEKNYNKEVLSNIFLNWSTANQQDFIPWLNQATLPLLWISGERDRRYIERAQHIRKTALHIKFKTISGSAHRVLFDQPNELSLEIKNFIKTIS